jgi:hypothetical protein
MPSWGEPHASMCDADPQPRVARPSRDRVHVDDPRVFRIDKVVIRHGGRALLAEDRDL